MRRPLSYLSCVCALSIVSALPLAVAAQTAPVPTAAHPHYFTRAVSSVTLSEPQKAEIAAITARYRKAHPDRAPHDARAEQQFHQDVENVLTTAQRKQVEARVKQLRAAGI
jgi:hypothetical protein